MVKDSIQSPGASFGGAERRTFVRHPVDIDAMVSCEGAAGIARKIRDFCPGGMLLAAEQDGQDAKLPEGQQLHEGQVIDISFALEGKSQAYQLQGRVVRQDTDSSGVALLNPDLAVIQALMNLVELQRKPGHAQQSAAPAARADVIAACTGIVASALQGIATKSHETITSSLFEETKAIRDIGEQNRYFETLGILNNNRERIIDAFTHSVIEVMAGYQHGELADLGRETQAGEPGTFELAIVEEEALDNWLADTGTIESVQRAHNEVLVRLCRRLSEIFPDEIDNDNNPYGPALFTTAFADVMASLGLNHKMVLACQKVFKSVLVDALGDVYRSMDTLLVERGILPELTYEVPRSTTPPAESVDKEAVVEPGSEEQEAVTGGEPAADTHVDDSETAVPTHNIYELVAELRTLKRQLRERVGEQPAGQSPGDIASVGTGQEDLPANVVPLTQGEVINTLARIESNCVNLDRDQVKELISSSLAANRDEHGEAKGVAPREERIIDVSNSIFDTLLSDVQVPESMHAWLARMEIPVMKMAIDDDSLFLDRDHLVRQVVNKIAQLGLLIGEEESEGASGVRSALDWLVNLISTDYDGTLSVFKRVSDQLDLLIKAQDSKYEKKLGSVVEDFKAEAENDTTTAPNVETEFDSRDEYEKWLRRARRLKEGDWIMFDLDTDQHRRLCAGWIALHTGKVVFVDAEGSKDRVVFLDELAVLLHNGKAMTLDDANEPAMDRAQYSMLQELNEQLVYESTHDQLTGLINRREFEKEIGRLLVNSRHSNIRHALCFIDLDQFNVINSTYGYEAGDMLLAEMSRLLAKEDLHVGVLARLGSDEFGLLLEDVVLEDALGISEELIHRAREHKFMWDGKRVSTGASIGLVPISNQDESISSLMQAAESSCKIAKDMGGNRLQLYSTGQRFSRRSEIINWAARIDDVLDNDRLKLRCQKILPLNNTGQKPHYEVLLALTDEHGDNISIQPFIEAAEWGHRIADIDRWVISKSLEWIGSNKHILESVGSFSINLSGRSLSDETLVDYVIERVDASSVPASALCFEITETIGVENLSDSSEFIKRIKQSGCSFSLDDFGSGMSSYAYLKNLPVDYLKIDGTFVREIKNNISDYAVVKSICEIGHFMGKQVVAEYVEDKETAAMLSEIGVDYIQGYGVEKPIMLNELLAPAW